MKTNNNNNKVVSYVNKAWNVKKRETKLFYIYFLCMFDNHTCVLCIIRTTTNNLNKVDLKDSEK